MSPTMPTPTEKVITHLKSIGEHSKFLELFNSERTLQEMFQEFYNRHDILQILNLPTNNPAINRKCEIASEKFRLSGNKLYQERKFSKALEAFNLAVLTAPHPEQNVSKCTDKRIHSQESLSLAFANRSALLYEVNSFKDCIADIDRAFDFGSPENKQEKLQDRRQKSTKAALVKKENKNDKLSIRGGFETPSFPNKTQKKENCAVKIHYTKMKGRHLIADRDIEPGELLFGEKASCSILSLSGQIRKFCCVCLNRADVPLPCPTCSLVTFCSPRCRDSSRNVHRIECNILPILVQLQADEEVGLVFRTLLKLSIKDVLTELEHLNSVHNKLENTNINKLVESKLTYSTLYYLEGNLPKRNSEHLFDAVANAVVVVQMLQRIPQFWINKKSEILPQDKTTLLTLGGEVARLLLNFQCNIHCIKELKITNHVFSSNQTSNIGYGIYNAFSLTNHSCIPNALHAHWGDTKHLFAINFIPKGTEIVDSYGERYVSHHLKERRQNLKEFYFFDCNCEACQRDFPLYDSLQVEFALRCRNCDIEINNETKICPNCQRQFIKSKKNRCKDSTLYDAKQISQKLSDAWQHYEVVCEEIKKLKTSQQNIQKVSKFISLMDKYTTVPHMTLVQAQETLLRCYELMGSFQIQN